MACVVFGLLPGLLPDASLAGMRHSPSLPQCSRSTVALQPAIPQLRCARAVVQMMSDEDEQQQQQLQQFQQQQQQQQQPVRRWRKRAKSAGATLAAAALLALPRGPASAAEQRPEPTSVSRDVDSNRGTPPLAFLGGKKYKVTPPFQPGEVDANRIDMDAIVSKKMAKKYTGSDFLFSDSLTQKSALEDELEQLDTARRERGAARAVGTLLTYGGALGGVYLTVRGLSNVERWMKQQELRDIEEERELTGQYISVDAGDVETAIDPLTGKNLTIVGGKKKSNATNADGSPAEAKEVKEEQTPWLLKVLGLGGAAASDADDFWEAPAASEKKAEGGASPKAKSSADPDAPDGAPADGDSGDDDDDDDDDTSGVDTLGDLLG